MAVRAIKKDRDSGIDAADFVRVAARSAPDDDTVTLVTIERMVDRNSGRAQSAPDWRVKTLLRECRMSAAEAVGLATEYARRKGIPVVLAAQD